MKTLSTCLMASLLMPAATLLDPVGTATLGGTFTDATGAVIQGAELVLKNTSLRFSSQITTDARGEYGIPAHPPGNNDPQTALPTSGPFYSSPMAGRCADPLRGLWFWNLDSSLGKGIPFKEKIRVMAAGQSS